MTLGRPRPRRSPRTAGAGLVAAVVAVVAGPTAIGEAAPDRWVERPFEVVLEREVAGDLVMAGNTSVSVDGRTGITALADVDGDTSAICLAGDGGPSCLDNSSSARVDLPPGSRVIAARLYVTTTVPGDAAALRVRIDGPDDAVRYTALGAATVDIPELWEATGHGEDGSGLRQAVWDVSAYVAEHGSGRYTVADIVATSVGGGSPSASWAIVVAYELDPSSGIDLVTQPPDVQQRFARRALSWHDGFVFQSAGSLDVTVGGFTIASGPPVFAKTFHLVAGAEPGAADNLLFAGNPLGNNASPDDVLPPSGVPVGTDLPCNSTTDVFNATTCSLGALAVVPLEIGDLIGPSTAARPSPVGVDMDVIRVPDRYLRAGMTTATLSVRTVGDHSLAPGFLAVSIDLAHPPAMVPG